MELVRVLEAGEHKRRIGEGRRLLIRGFRGK